jgi:ABC-2 type transport system ATP-binding protein
MSVSVNNIAKIYGKQLAVDSVSFEVKEGEIVGFLGPNGAGKSTTMKILTGFIPQTSGSAFVCGYDVAENSLEVRKNIGYLPEHNPLYLDMYVKEYLLFIGGIHGIENKSTKTAEIINKVGLDAEKNKKIGALSKGYRQRVGLARALIHNPRVLILDEPTSGLDPNQIIEIRNLIRQIGKEKTIIMSTHIMQEVEAVCDRVIIINKGKIVADSPAKEIRSSFGINQVILVEFSKSINSNLLKEIEGIKNAEQAGENSWKIIADKKADIRPAIFHFAVNNNIEVLSLQKEEQKLEQVFKELTSSN